MLMSFLGVWCRDGVIGSFIVFSSWFVIRDPNSKWRPPKSFGRSISSVSFKSIFYRLVGRWLAIQHSGTPIWRKGPPQQKSTSIANQNNWFPHHFWWTDRISFELIMIQKQIHYWVIVINFLCFKVVDSAFKYDGMVNQTCLNWILICLWVLSSAQVMNNAVVRWRLYKYKIDC